MDLLTALGSLGLPGWLMSVAALVIILHYTGLIKWLGDLLRDEQEAWQEERQHRLHSKAQATATQELREERVEAVALEIVRENNRWAKEEFTEMLKVLQAQTRILEQIRNNIVLLSGHIAKLTDRVEEVIREHTNGSH